MSRCRRAWLLDPHELQKQTLSALFVGLMIASLKVFCVACILVLIMILSLEHVLSNTRTFSGFCCEGCVHGWFAKKSLQKPFCSEHLISPQRPTFFSDIPWTGDYKKELTVFFQGSGKPNNRRFEVHGFAFPRLLELSGGGPTSCSTLNTLKLQG